MRIVSTSVLLLLAALTAQADVSMVVGHVYDVGKGSYSGDSSVGERADTELCWAATAANMFQHWQDWYLEWYTVPGMDPDATPDTESATGISTATFGSDLTLTHVSDIPYSPAASGSATSARTTEASTTTDIPDGTNDKGYKLPSGTQYLEIYDKFTTYFKDSGGLIEWATEWYFDGSDGNYVFNNKKGNYLKTAVSSGGYLPGKVNTYITLFRENFSDLAGLKQVLDIPFGYAGAAVYLGIITPGGGGHAITCWGYETDPDGTLCALYITDSDDRQFGARRIDVTMQNGKLVLSSPYKYGSYSSGTYTINEVSFILNSGSIYKKDGNFGIKALEDNAVIDEAFEITGQRLASATGLTMEQGGLLVSSGGEGTSLTLGGGEVLAEGNGITALAGSMVSLNNAAVSVSGFEGHGISIGCEVNLSGGSVAVSGNGGTGIAVQGTPEDPKAFLQMHCNASVEISGNKAGGLVVGAGCIERYNQAGSYLGASCEALLQDNTLVEIRGNSAEQGGGARITGYLAILGNGTLTIADNTAATGAAIYAGSQTVASPQYEGLEYVFNADVEISGNSFVNITGNKATKADIISACGNSFSLSDNGKVTISGNDARTSTKAADGYVFHNTGTLSIVRNDSLTFSGNSAKYDIFNEGKLYLAAGAGQSITFEHGFHNTAAGTTYLGKDSSGKAVGPGGTYKFEQGGSAVTMETAGTATFKAKGGAVMQQEDGKGALTLNLADFAGDTSFSLQDTNLTLSDVAFAGDVTFDLGFYADMNKLDLTGAQFAEGTTVSFILDLGSEAGKGGGITLFGYPWQDVPVDSDSLTRVEVSLQDYITGGASALDGVELALTVTGTIADDALLVIDTEGFNLALSEVDVPDCIYRSTDDGKIFYGAPEPTTATLSLLALAALCARRRRSGNIHG